MPGRTAPLIVGGMQSIGRILMLAGVALAAIGAVLWLYGRAGGTWLPGDLVIEKPGFRLYFPVVICLVISVFLTVIAWLFRR